MHVKPPFSQNKPPTLHQKCSSNLCKMIPKWSQKRSRSGPRDTSKETQQNFTKVYQKSPKVYQKAPHNDPKKDIKITKDGIPRSRLSRMFSLLQHDADVLVMLWSAPCLIILHTTQHSTQSSTLWSHILHFLHSVGAMRWSS
jgi:hypothetical protein